LLHPDGCSERAGRILGHPDQLIANLLDEADRLSFQPQVLGCVQDYPLVLLRPAPAAVDRPHLLVAAGFHGDEPAGPLAILEALGELPAALLQTTAVTFLPLVNPSGFRHHRRINDRGEDPNRGYCHPELCAHPSAEGQVLLEHFPLLLDAARDGFLSLHEDWEETHVYLYTSEEAPPAGELARHLRDRGACHFALRPDGLVGNAPVREGILFQDCDGSLEDLLHHFGVPLAVCTETPGGAPLAQRIACDLDLVQTTIAHLGDPASRHDGPATLHGGPGSRLPAVLAHREAVVAGRIV